MTAVMQYLEVAGWGEETWDDRDVTGVAVDSRDRVYVLRRGQNPVTVLDAAGTVVDRWGDGYFSDRPHLISIGHDDTVYVADDGGHRVLAFDTTGRLRETIGTGVPSNTGFDVERYGSAEAALDQMQGGPPFNRPTKAVSNAAGELFVSDGYRNCRIHRYSADRQQVHSWGGPGAADGSFVIPHSVTVDHDGRILVCDRENDRIQVFDRDGNLLQVWTHVQRPTDVAVDRHGYVYVTELARGPRDLKSWRLGRPGHELPGRVSVWSPHGGMVARISSAVNLLAPHAIAVDSIGAIYVAEVPQSFATATGRPRRQHRCLHKFAAG